MKLSLVGNLLIEAGKDTLDNITKFIRKNTKLQHLNLTSCGLTSADLKQICDSVHKSGSILSLHLDLNPGVDEEVIEYFREKLRCKPHE